MDYPRAFIFVDKDTRLPTLKIPNQAEGTRPYPTRHLWRIDPDDRSHKQAAAYPYVSDQNMTRGRQQSVGSTDTF